MAIPPGFVDELRNRITVSEIVGKRVKLIKKGKEHSGLCPFHNEKSPSFTVNDEKGFYHCFGCGAHGSALDFIMNTEGLTFPEAVERLAIQAGMDVPQDTPEQRQRSEQRNTLYDVMEKACAYYQKSLRMPEGKIGLNYLKNRGLSEETIKRFRLGYSPNVRDGLKAALKREGIDENLMIEAGLLIQPDDRTRAPYERFRERVMFPITDRRGKVIAFGGRLLGDGKPKYLNSPDTPLFHKGTILYGLAQAREAAHKREQIIVTEGYMDVIALAQGGFENAVAPLGTALTEDQIQLLWRFAPNPLLCLDGDSAGQRAALRAAERALPLLKPGNSLHFVTLPEGEDPDSLIAKEGRQAMQDLLNRALPLSEQLWRAELAKTDLSTPENRAALEDALRKHAFQIADETVKSHFLSGYKDRIWAEVKKQRKTDSPPRLQAKPWFKDKNIHHTQQQAGSLAREKINLEARREELLIGAVIFHPEIIDEVGERLGIITFRATELDKLRQEVLKTLDGESGFDADQLQNHLHQIGFSTTLNTLFRNIGVQKDGARFGHGAFLRPDRPIDDVLRGWDQCFHLYWNAKDLKAELNEWKQRLVREMTPEVLSQFQAFQRLMGQVDSDEDEGLDHSNRMTEEDLLD